MGKLHGTLAKAGKVKKQTPKVEKQVKHKLPKGRAYKRILYNRRYNDFHNPKIWRPFGCCCRIKRWTLKEQEP